MTDVRYGNRMLYVARDDAATWQRAEKIAAERGVPLVKLITEQLRGLSSGSSQTITEILNRAEELIAEARRRTDTEEN